MRVFDIVRELESTSSRNKKIEILKQNQDNKVFKDTLYYTYNPFLDYYVIKLPKLKVGSYEYEDKFAEFKTLLDDLNDRKFTGLSATERLMNLLEQMNEEGQIVAKQVLERKFRKAGISTKTINKVFPNLIPEFNVQLANTYEITKKDKYPKKFVASTKLDGIRAMYLKDKGLFTRNGHKITIFKEIEDECRIMCEEGQLEFLDGELWTGEFDFNTIQSAVMSDKVIKPEIAKKIKYNVFACSVDEGQTSEDMLNLLNDLYNNLNLEKIVIVQGQVIDNDLDVIVKMTIDNVDVGYEGLMLRDLYHPYSWTRDDHLLKVKRFQLYQMRPHLPHLTDEINRVLDDLRLDDFVIIDVIEGTGNFKGMMGALLIEGQVNGKTIRSKVGTGFKLDERKEFWKNRENLIGKEVVIVCQEITKDNSLRFPVIESIKLDR